MKSHVPVSSYLTDKQMEELKAKMKEIADEEYQRLNNQATRRLFQLIAVSLSRQHGFGKKRISRLFDGLSDLMTIHDNDPVFWEHIAQRCQQIGVDLGDAKEKM